MAAKASPAEVAVAVAVVTERRRVNGGAGADPWSAAIRRPASGVGPDDGADGV